MDIQTLQKKIKPAVTPGKRPCTQLNVEQSAGVQSMLRNRRIQPKLRVGQVNDRYEQEADRVADKVVSGGNIVDVNTISPIGGAAKAQRMCEECDDELQRKPEQNASDSIAGTQVNMANSHLSAGRKLPDAQLRFFGSRMGHRFDNVRIHTNHHAARLADTINARAYTLGPDIVFNQGQYRLGTREGDRLLAHELVHVVQQRGGMPERVQRSCFDGVCEDCDGGIRDLWVTVFFARRANRTTMEKIRRRINKAKEILGDCCVNIKFDFNWTLIPGAASIETASRHARPANDPLGLRDVPEPQETIGEGDLIANARGIPLLIVDEIRGTGGGTTILGGQDDRGTEYDVEYTGPSMFFMAVNQPREGACSRDDLTIAHELWHVTGALRHNAADGAITDCSGEGVAEPYCTRIRDLT